MRKIMKLNGECFPTKLSAKGQAAKIAMAEGGNKDDYLIAEVTEGFVILAPDIAENPESVIPHDTNTHEQESTQLAASPCAQQDVATENTGEEPAAQKKHKKTTPWNPSRKLDIQERHKNPNFDYKMANTSRPGRIKQLVDDGYEIDKELSTKMNSDVRAFDRHDKKLDGTTQINELLVMRIPKDIAKEIRSYYAEQANGAQEKNEGEVGEKLGDGMSLYIPEEAKGRAQARRGY